MIARPEPGDSLYRYELMRKIDVLFVRRKTVLFVMLNPSTADENLDDPTIRRCVGFARSWGFTELRVVNLFAYRATNPDTLRQVADPVGPLNDEILAAEIGHADLVVAAWGVHGGWKGRDDAVVAAHPGVQWTCLGTTACGRPRHPLYVRADMTPRVWNPPKEGS